jgi:hypothetical protein
MSLLHQLRRPSGLTLRSRAILVTVLSEERTNATASRLNSPDYLGVLPGIAHHFPAGPCDPTV